MITTEVSLRFRLDCEQQKSKNLFEELMEYKNRVEQLEDDLAAVNGVKRSQAQQPTGLSKQLREYAADSGYSHNDYADTMLAAAYEIEQCESNCAKLLSEQDYQYNKQTNELIARHATQIKMLEQQNLALIEQLVEVDLLTPRTYIIELPEGSTSLIGGEYHDKTILP